MQHEICNAICCYLYRNATTYLHPILETTIIDGHLNRAMPILIYARVHLTYVARMYRDVIKMPLNNLFQRFIAIGAIIISIVNIIKKCKRCKYYRKCSDCFIFRLTRAYRLKSIPVTSNKSNNLICILYILKRILLLIKIYKIALST